MIWNRLIGNRSNSEYRYFRVNQSDGLQYEIELHKNDVLKQLEYWLNTDEIKFKEIYKKEYYKGFNKNNILS